MTTASASSLWRNRSYMLLWSGQVVSTLGSTASEIIYPLLILALTDSPAAAGIAGAMRAIPYLVFSLPVGALIDRWDRKRVMILCDAGRAVAVASLPVAMLFDALTLWQIYAVAFVEGSLFVFFNIAEVAALPRVVPQHQLPEATAQNQAAFGIVGIIGPALGTFLYQTFGRAIPFLVDALSYVLSIVSLRMIKLPFRVAAPQAPRHLAHEIMEGLRWLWERPLIRYMAILTGVINFVVAAVPLLIIVSAKGMGASTASVGLIFSTGAVGAIVGALIGGRIQKRFSFGAVIITVIWVQAFLFPFYAIVPSYLLLGVVSGLIFTTVPIYNVVQFSYRLALIPDGLQGRVNSVFRLLAFGLTPLGAALSGVMIERFGVVASILAFSAVYFAMAVLTTLNPHVRSARSIERLPT